MTRAAPPSTAPSVEAVLRGTAMQAERVVAVARIALATSSAVRSYWIWSGNGWKGNVGRALVSYPATGVAILFSLAFLLRVWRPTRVARFLYLSVATDVLCCLAALLPNALWPWEGALRIGIMPDVSGLLLVMFAA